MKRNKSRRYQKPDFKLYDIPDVMQTFGVESEVADGDFAKKGVFFDDDTHQNDIVVTEPLVTSDPEIDDSE